MYWGSIQVRRRLGCSIQIISRDKAPSPKPQIERAGSNSRKSRFSIGCKITCKLVWVYPVISHKLTHKYHGRLKSNSVILFSVYSSRGEKGVSGSYRASGTPLKPLRITPGKGVVPVPGSSLPRMAPVDQQLSSDTSK